MRIIECPWALAHDLERKLLAAHPARAPAHNWRASGRATRAVRTGRGPCTNFQREQS
jgi:hypothetical protein